MKSLLSLQIQPSMVEGRELYGISEKIMGPLWCQEKRMGPFWCQSKGSCQLSILEFLKGGQKSVSTWDATKKKEKGWGLKVVKVEIKETFDKNAYDMFSKAYVKDLEVRRKKIGRLKGG